MVAMRVIGEILELRTLLGHLRLDRGALEELRERKLRALIHHAYQRVPYYRTLFDSAGVDPKGIRTVGDLEKVPITTKGALRRAGLERILARGTDPEACVVFRTSGSSGTPFAVYQTRPEARTRRLVELRGLLRAGMRIRDRLAVLGPVRWNSLRFFQRLGLHDRINISPRLPVEDQIDRLRGFRPTILWAYPGPLRVLLHHLDGRLSAVCSPRILITSAEAVPWVQRDQIGRDLEVEWFNFYGSMEVGRIAWECAAHQGLHLNADRLILELANEYRGSGEAVVTPLDRWAMPFIRYELGDVCAFLPHTCPCGVTFPLISPPTGRTTDLIRLASGRVLSSWGVDTILRDFTEIDQYRIVQEDATHFVVQLAAARPLPPATIEDLKSRLLEYLREPVHLDMVTCEAIAGGSKYRSFASRMG